MTLVQLLVETAQERPILTYLCAAPHRRQSRFYEARVSQPAMDRQGRFQVVRFHQGDFFEYQQCQELAGRGLSTGRVFLSQTVARLRVDWFPR
jgi:hypothetical protein